MTHPHQTWPWWCRTVTGLSALGLVLSAYLGWHYVAGGTVLGCGGGSPCDQVLGSRWSAIGGVLPVSGLAAGVYLAMLVASLCLGPATEASVRWLAWRALLVLAGAATGGAVWFTILQRWVIGAFCPYCMATHLTSLALAALVLWRASVPAGRDESETGSDASKAPTDPLVPVGFPAVRNAIRPRLAIGLNLLGLSLAGIMAVFQVVFTPVAVYQGGESPRDQLPALDPHAVPLVGSPAAPYVVTVLFDYKCPHCQRLHAMLGEVVRRYGGKVAFALCPTPLNPQCNPYVPQAVAAFQDSCVLARIGLTVWVAKPEAFSAFDNWMLSPDAGQLWHPRSVAAALAKAVELVGPAKFEAARNASGIDQHLQTSVRIFGRTGGNAVPKLVFGSHWVNPEPVDADDLIAVLHAGLAIPKP